jgi:xanthine dehydrogenase YagS FAD-binding subunit
MRPFRYEKAPDPAAAVRLSAKGIEAKYLGGGTNLVDLMRENIERPEIVIDVTGFSCEISDEGDGGLVINAGTKNTAVASRRAVRERYPMLAQAILTGASPQIRNMATVGGNPAPMLSPRLQVSGHKA